VEGDLAAVGSTSGGRVLRVIPREGDKLESGALIAEMQSAQRQAEFERAEHLLHTARAQVTLAAARVVSLEREQEAGQLAVSQADQNSGAQIGEAQAGLGVARAHLRQAETDSKKSARDRARYERLSAEKAISAGACTQTFKRRWMEGQIEVTAGPE
jgi:multidrug efflux pump subunit AcrA (membrane-fusion protein)